MRVFLSALFAAVLLVTIAVVAHDSKRGLNYLYNHDGGHQILSGGSLHLGHIEKMAGKFSGKFFWFSHDGREYVIRDAATLASIDQLFAPMRALDPDVEAIQRRLRPLEEQERAVEKKMEAIEEQIEDAGEQSESASRSLESKLRDLEMSLRRVEERMRVIERDEERLDRKLDELEKDAERKLLPLLQRAVREKRAEKL